jgi:protein O-mannosyl-transferase
MISRNVNRKYYFIGLILLITLVSYWPVLHLRSFVWDDEGYIANNLVIKSFHLKEILSGNVMGNYHPVTVLALAVEYFFFGPDAIGYHWVNLVLHFMNVLLVYVVIQRVCRKYQVALIAALLFGIHPIHVESVAWISGLKDLLFTLFFLLSWLLYLEYRSASRVLFYFISLFLFLFSLSSKSMAVSLPVVLLLTDYFQGRKMNRLAWMEKIPFFILSLVFGVVAIFTQKSSGNISVWDYTFLQQLSMSCYGFVSYLFKLVLPVKLSAFYPYPAAQSDSFQSGWYLLLLTLIIFSYLLYFSFRNSRKIFFGFGFFVLTIFLVLQWFPVGKAIMADRYAYVPSIGFFFLAGEGWITLSEKRKKWLAYFLLGTFTVFFSFRTFDRCGVWKNEIILWNDVLHQHENVPLAYLNRGIAYARQNEYDKAIEDISKAIQLDTRQTKAYYSNYARAYYNRGNMYFNQGRFDLALQDFNKCIEWNPKYGQAYFNRGNIYTDTREYDKALADFSRAAELNPRDAKPFVNRGYVFGLKKEYEKALHDFDMAVRLNPEDPGIYFNRGMLFLNMQDYVKSIESFSKTLKINPNDPEALFNRGLAEYYSSDKKAAERDMRQAAGLGYKPAGDFLRIIADHP